MQTLTRTSSTRRSPDFGPEPWRQKAFVEFHIDAVLNAITDAGREPDAWEATQLHAAIGALLGGNYFQANMHVHLALTTPAQRSATWLRCDDTAQCADLRVSLDAVSLLSPPSA
ncbi:MAG TPA: hypothetical protein VGM74_10635 [Burkholderiaceae bacterium]